MPYEDKNMTCKDCGKDFVWTAGEQEFYAQKGFQNAPTRCQDCRRKWKEQKRAGQQMYEIICAQCGKKGEVPFQPRDPSSVLCADCFRASRGGGEGKAEEAKSEETGKEKTDKDETAKAE